MTAPAHSPLTERIADWLTHLAHHLPAQAPIRNFVHHNTLHGLQHLSFPAALAAARQRTGARPYWPEERFRQAFADGRIVPADLLAAIDEAGPPEQDAAIVPGISRRQVLLASLHLPPAPPASHLDWLAREKSPDPRLADCQRLLADQAGTDADANWETLACQRWQALLASLGSQATWRGLLEHLTGEDLLASIARTLRRHLGAHLDLGQAAWHNPARPAGFYAAWRASAAVDPAWDLDELPGARDRIAELSDDPLQALCDNLRPLLADENAWPGYLERLAQEWPGWAGMFARRADLALDATPVTLLDYLTVRVILERLLGEALIVRLTGQRLAFAELAEHFAARPAEFFLRDALRSGALDETLQHRIFGLLRHGRPSEARCRPLAEAVVASRPADTAAAWRLAQLLRRLDLPASALDAAGARRLLAEADRLDPLARGQLWLLAYEHHYRQQLFAALAANHGQARDPARPSAQVVLCMDDREEGTRRHLEEIAPSIATYGAAGFFGVPLYWRGLADAATSALCPVVVKPAHRVDEVARDPAAGRRHTARQTWRRHWRERFLQGSRRSLAWAPLLAALGALPALAGLVLGSLTPAGLGRLLAHWRRAFEGQPSTNLALTADEAPPLDGVRAGFTTAEQVERVAAFLRTIGLTGQFAPLVVMLGHGSDSRNNPHLAAYDCGACSGRHGGPNARVFAAMANRPEVRAGLLALDITIPESCLFIAGEHNTCDDSIEWYDCDRLPASHQAAFDELAGQLAQACRAHAAERCRRLASAPATASPAQGERHVRHRRFDISQARPELGHATNAAAFIGRRTMSRGLFLDRRVFLISYDPSQDDDGRIVEGILLAAGPVGAGISLEYYFSTVDNERFGCGSKVTHNLTGLFGVMEGADSDLRTGLPWQMVEIHEPMRLLVVVEQDTAQLDAVIRRQAALQELVGQGWIVLAAQHPVSGALAHYRPGLGWQAWQAREGEAAVPLAASSSTWTRGERGPLPPARIVPGARSAA